MPPVWHIELTSVVCGDLVGRKSEKDEIDVNIPLIHFAVCRNYCRASLLQQGKKRTNVFTPTNFTGLLSTFTLDF